MLKKNSTTPRRRRKTAPPTKEGRRESDTTHRTRKRRKTTPPGNWRGAQQHPQGGGEQHHHQQEGESNTITKGGWDSSTNQRSTGRGKAVPLRKTRRQTRAHKSTKRKATPPKRVTQVSKTMAMPKDPSNRTHYTNNRNNTQEPMTPEARGSDFPTSLTFNNDKSPKRRKRMASRTSPKEETTRGRATPPKRDEKTAIKFSNIQMFWGSPWDRRRSGRKKNTPKNEK